MPCSQRAPLTTTTTSSKIRHDHCHCLHHLTFSRNFSQNAPPQFRERRKFYTFVSTIIFALCDVASASAAKVSCEFCSLLHCIAMSCRYSYCTVSLFIHSPQDRKGHPSENDFWLLGHGQFIHRTEKVIREGWYVRSNNAQSSTTNRNPFFR